MLSINHAKILKSIVVLSEKLSTGGEHHNMKDQYTTDIWQFTINQLSEEIFIYSLGYSLVSN